MPLPISNAEHIYRSMRHSIINGELAQGERLLIRVLCEQFGTSSSPVIEAIRRLEQEGLVTSRPNAGAQVTEWSAKDVVHSYIVREALDAKAARLFVDCATQEQRQTLTELNENFHEASRSRNVTQAREADTAYHQHIISCTMPFPIQKAMESVYAITMAFISNQPNIPQMFQEDMHDEMTDVLLGDDPVAAEVFVRDSMRGALGALIQFGIIDQKAVPISVEADILTEVA